MTGAFHHPNDRVTDAPQIDDEKGQEQEAPI